MIGHRTSRGTEIINGVERSTPPPPFVVKAMERRWAEELVVHGRVRLSSFQYYKTFDDPQVGDQSEGDGRYAVGDSHAHMGCAYAVFLFCTSLPDTAPQDLLALQPGYDTVIRINRIEEFARAVSLTAHEQEGLFLKPYIGQVVYDRDDRSTFNAINAKPWGWNILQKDERHSHQREYRFAFEHFATPRLDRPKTEDEVREEMYREHVYLQLTLQPGVVEIVIP